MEVIVKQLTGAGAGRGATRGACSNKRPVLAGAYTKSRNEEQPIKHNNVPSQN